MSTINEAKKRSVEMDGIFDALVNSVRARPDLDLNNPACLVDVRLAREKAEDIPTGVLEQLISDLLHAGIDASAQSARWLLLILANRPAIQEKVHKELDRAIGLDAIQALEDRERLPYLNVAILENM